MKLWDTPAKNLKIIIIIITIIIIIIIIIIIVIIIITFAEGREGFIIFFFWHRNQDIRRYEEWTFRACLSKVSPRRYGPDCTSTTQSYARRLSYSSDKQVIPACS